MILLDSVSKIFKKKGGQTVALEEIDLTVPRGQFVLLKGPSGSGKTTLLNLISAMLRPTEGEISVDGQRLSELSAEQRAIFRASHIGFVFQMFHLVPYLSVKENVALGAIGRPEGSEVNDLLEKLGMAEKVDSLPGELSAGEKQRVAIARALVNTPQLILADEPTGNLDRESAARVLSYLEDYHREGGTLILASHDELAGSSAERVIELQRGKLSSDRLA